MDAILEVFNNVGDMYKRNETYNLLCELYKKRSAKYPEKKASASIGGSVNGKTIAPFGKYYKRIR